MLGGTARLAVFTSLPVTSMLYKLTETHYFNADSDMDAHEFVDQFNRVVGFGDQAWVMRVGLWERVYVWFRNFPLRMLRMSSEPPSRKGFEK
ncbi:hypothetical protein A2264_01920 [candidate division WWE3 bacterium RIFOXYA2_FULL_46_9]|uniref:Uncharacterized protein n=1 Tax=candidate division WWE3 bacterium RIFOXYA2_FULL_46_9 TaxID=1802636 RepID=A0A1F4W0R6_UNCKA|nr:MAG: hypothetical protein A2264_01920 [candidate division WWE3 bacterium RIFOXYA2_FULL_46_9]